MLVRQQPDAPEPGPDSRRDLRLRDTVNESDRSLVVRSRDLMRATLPVDVGEVRLCQGRLLEGSGREEQLGCFGKLAFTLTLHQHERLAERKQETRIRRVVPGPELECFRVEAGGRLQGAQRIRTVSGLAQRVACR